MCQLKIVGDVEDKVLESLEGFIRVNLIDWPTLRNDDFIRNMYQVIKITSYPDPFRYRDNWEVRTDVIGYANNAGIHHPVARCQEMYYFGMEEHGSIVCENCLYVARFALFSLQCPAYIVKVHTHSFFTPMCLHCSRLISSKPLNKCSSHENEVGIFEKSPLYRCLRMSRRFVVRKGMIEMLGDDDEVVPIGISLGELVQ